MCEYLIREQRTGKPIDIENRPHHFSYRGLTKETVLIKDIPDMKGVITYAAVHRIENSHGVKKGYMFIIGEE
jgi:hypothetical protein